MSYQYYKNRVLRKGKTNQERIVYEKKRSFEEYLYNAPNSYKVEIDGNECLAVIQDVSFNDELYQAKYILITTDTPISVGSIVEWDNKCWIVITKEEETVKSHQACKMQPCNNYLTFQDENNPSIIHKVPCVLSSKATPYATGIQEVKYVILAEDRILAIVPNNEITQQIKLNKRFIFDYNKDNIYKVTKIDMLTQKGLINITISKDEYNPAKDRLDLNIADYIGTEKESETPIGEGHVVTIEGSDTIQLLTTETYHATVYHNDTEIKDKAVVWELSRDDLVTIEQKDDTSIILNGYNSGWKTGELILKATLSDDETVYTEKTIYVRGF